MSNNVPNDEPVATDSAEDLIRLILGDVVELDDLTAEPHRLSEEAVVFRARSLQRRRSDERIREGVREILTELELYRIGYDEGFDAGYERAIADVLNCVRAESTPKGGVDSSLHACEGCGVDVIGFERCGDPTRPGCAKAAGCQGDGVCTNPRCPRHGIDWTAAER